MINKKGDNPLMRGGSKGEFYAVIVISIDLYLSDLTAIRVGTSALYLNLFNPRLNSQLEERVQTDG